MRAEAGAGSPWIMVLHIHACAVLLIFGLAVVACSGGGDHTVTRPPSVPSTARLASKQITLGAPAPTSNDDTFQATACSDDVMAVTTSREVIFAELPCDRALPDSVAQRFRMKPVRIRIVPGTQSKLYIESESAGTVEFTPGHVWLQAR